MNDKNLKIADYILNKGWDLKYFDNLDLSIFSQTEQALFLLCKQIKLNNESISALTIFNVGGKSNLLLYIGLQDNITQKKLNDEYKQKEKYKYS